MDPQQAVALLGMDFVDINIRRQAHVAVKHAVIDLHRYRLKRPIFATSRLRHFTDTTDRQVAGAYGEIDFRLIHASEFNADLNTMLAAVRIYRRLPWWRSKRRKAGPGKLRRHIVQCAVEPT